MSGPDIITNMTEGWSRAPTGVASGSDRSGISSALWTHLADDEQEVWADPCDAFNISVLRSSLWAQVKHDGRHIIEGIVRKDGVTIVPAGVRPAAVHRGAWSIVHFYVPRRRLADVVTQEIGLDGAQLELIDPLCSPDPHLAALSDRIIEDMQRADQWSRLKTDAIGLGLMVYLLQSHSNLGQRHVGVSRPLRGGLAPLQLRRVTERLENRIDDDVSLAELARLVDLSPAHLCRAFKASTGMPPHRWLMQKRVKRAQQLMTGTPDTLASIAAACGFASQQHLSTVFKREVGATPAAWRRERHL